MPPAGGQVGEQPAGAVQPSGPLVQVAAEGEVDSEVERISRCAPRPSAGGRVRREGADERRRPASTTATAVRAAARGTFVAWPSAPSG